MAVHEKNLGRADLNRGPHRPERCALPGCATPRCGPIIPEIGRSPARSRRAAGPRSAPRLATGPSTITAEPTGKRSSVASWVSSRRRARRFGRRTPPSSASRPFAAPSSRSQQVLVADAAGGTWSRLSMNRCANCSSRPCGGCAAPTAASCVVRCWREVAEVDLGLAVADVVVDQRRDDPEEPLGALAALDVGEDPHGYRRVLLAQRLVVLGQAAVEPLDRVGAVDLDRQRPALADRDRDRSRSRRSPRPALITTIGIQRRGAAGAAMRSAFRRRRWEFHHSANGIEPAPGQIRP